MIDGFISPSAREPKKEVKPGIFLTKGELDGLVASFGADCMKYHLDCCSDWLVSKGERREDSVSFLNRWITRSKGDRNGFFREKVEYPDPMKKDGPPWVSTAPRFKGDASQSDPSPEYLAWLKLERQKLYRSVDSNGDIFWVQNPAAWAWTVSPEGKFTFIKPPPIPTGEKAQKKKAMGQKWQY